MESVHTEKWRNVASIYRASELLFLLGCYSFTPSDNLVEADTADRWTDTVLLAFGSRHREKGVTFSFSAV